MHMKRALTVLGTLALAAAVLWAADPRRLVELAAGLDPAWLPLLAATAPALAGLSVWKWWLLLRVRVRAAPGFFPLLGLYATGQFYNQVLPSNSGGDVVRGELLARRLRAGGPAAAAAASGGGGGGGGGRAAAYASITAERFTGLAVLVAMAVPAALVPAFWSSPVLMLGVLAGTLLSVGVMAGVLLVPPGAGRAGRVGRAGGAGRGRPSRVGRLAAKALAKLAGFSADLRSHRAHPRALLAALGLSVGYYAVAVGSVVVAAACFGGRIGWLPAAAATAAVLVVSLLPVSINGLGLWEASFLASFEALGLGGELGLAVALLLRARDLAWAVGGASVAAALQGGGRPVPAARPGDAGAA